MPAPAPTTDQLRKLGYPMTPDGVGVQMPPRPRTPFLCPPTEEAFAEVAAMTGRQRVTAMYEGRLTIQQLCKWAATAPDQVAVVDDEFLFIVAGLPNYDTAAPARTPIRSEGDA